MPDRIKPTAEERQKMMADHAEKVLSAPRRIDKTALSYWFPLIEVAGLPVPKTIIVPMPKDAQFVIWEGFDGNGDPGKDKIRCLHAFIDMLQSAGGKVGYPLFLRTDHTSGKHEWKKTCFVGRSEDMLQHVVQLAEFSEMVGMIGLPWDVFVIRELLPTIHHGVCHNYGGMPVVREFRFFVDDGVIRCWHPYWPKQALADGGCKLNKSEYQELCAYGNNQEIRALAERAGRAIGGSWSIDILETRRGWFVTDMAEAHKSFHMEGCPRVDKP